MIIRKAERYDIPGILRMTKEFQDEGLGQYTLGHTDESAEASITMFVTEQLAVVAVQDDEPIGVLGGFITPFFFDKDSIVFQEILWYVRKDKRKGGAGVKMLFKVMEEAKKMGVTHIVMAHTGKVLSDMIGKVYEKLGFEVLETQYIRGL